VLSKGHAIGYSQFVSAVVNLLMSRTAIFGNKLQQPYRLTQTSITAAQNSAQNSGVIEGSSETIDRRSTMHVVL